MAGPTVQLPAGEHVPALGQGTWYFAERASRREAEIRSLRTGLDLGLTLVDTAEMYADGAAEELTGEAIAGRRDEVFLVGKVLPYHATRRGTVQACRQSLERLGTDRLDLYLLHWPGSVPLEDTLAGFADLLEAGQIRYWGVSNFDTAAMTELAALAGGDAVATNQVLYNLTRRGPEFDLLPHQRQRRVPTMAYSPVEQGRVLGHPALALVAQRHGATAAQVALAWVLRAGDVCAIPRTGNAEHVRENAAALDLVLTAADLADLDAAFPAPDRKVPLEIL
jgi:diketogulonate reductase-like aldo/keto reductase